MTANPHALLTFGPPITRVDVARSALAALTAIKRLHAPVTVCRGCRLRECPGDCDWSTGDSDQVTICSLCCTAAGARTGREGHPGRVQVSGECVDSHDHVPGRPVCSTVEIIERAGL